MMTAEDFFQRIKRAGSDIAEDNANRTKGQGRQGLISFHSITFNKPQAVIVWANAVDGKLAVENLFSFNVSFFHDFRPFASIFFDLPRKLFGSTRDDLSSHFFKLSAKVWLR